MNHFRHFADAPSGELYDKAYLILCNAQDAASSFLHIFEDTRRKRRAQGTPTDEEQDLLRAMLIFASSGLDSMAKQLVRDTLPRLIELDVGSEKMFQQFVARRLARSEDINWSILAELIADRQPRDRLIQDLVEELVSGSLQSVEELMRVAAYFDIPSRSLVSRQEQDEFMRIFAARNEIIHEMDVDFNQPNRNRRPRRKQQMIDDTNRIFLVSERFLRGVAAKLEAVS